jgi:hypothetical protein
MVRRTGLDWRIRNRLNTPGSRPLRGVGIRSSDQRRRAVRKRLLLSLTLAGALVVASALPAQAAYFGESCDDHTGGDPSGTIWVCAIVNQSGFGLNTGDIAGLVSWYHGLSSGPDLIYIDYVVLQKLTPEVVDIQRVDPNQGYMVLGVLDDSTLSTDWAADPNPPGGPPDCPTSYDATYRTIVRYKLHYWGTPAGTWSWFFTTVSSVVTCSDLI